MKRVALAVLFAALAVPAFAQMKDMDMKGMEKKDAKKAQSHHASGTVKSVDAAKGSVTLEHGPVASLKWPAMTMGFKAKDKKTLESLKPGQKIEFEFVQQGKDYVITKVK